MVVKITAIDFETESIEKRPDYPPKPVGVAITESSGKSYYLSWEHPTENNCTKAHAIKVLKGFYKDSIILCHNAKFDLEVGEKFMGLPLVPKHGFECTLILAFLFDPRSDTLALKPLADQHLSMRPDEQTKLYDWIRENVAGVKKNTKNLGKYICLAPAKLVGKYAKGDTIRTKKLFTKFYRYVKDNKMLGQYEIEKRVVIKAIEMERVGINLDTKQLEPELVKAKKKLKQAENAVQKTLGNINLGSPKQKIEAFERLGLIDEWEYTDKGNPMTGVDSLMRVCTNKKLVKNLEVFSKYTKLISTYMSPWLESAQENNGKFYPWFNTIKGDNDRGTYTGRFSSNFQQVPKKPKEVFKGMPFLRDFIIPDKKVHTLLNRDFCGQEVRILAHFGDGTLLIAFNDKPDLDGHGFIKELIKTSTGVDYPRDYIKGCNFLIVYGGGAPALSKEINVSQDEARIILNTYDKAIPEVKELKKELKLLYRRGEEFVTAGGRLYDFEEGKEYVALNTLIQGSAADHTKRALLNISDMIDEKGYDARMILTVHDEFMLSVPKRQDKKIMKDFKESMEKDDLFDVPMLTDGKIGSRWGSMTKYKDQ